MPFLRFSRDKRGYEHFYLVEPATRRGKSRNRILYWFRTPPGVKVGRLPFDDHMRRALETRYPSVSFDWQKLIDTPIPPPAPDVERWRERRRLERAAKQAAASEAAAEMAESASEEGELREGVAPVPVPAAPVAAAADASSQPARRRRRRSGRRGRANGGVLEVGRVSAERTHDPANRSTDPASASTPPASPSTAADSPERGED